MAAIEWLGTQDFLKRHAGAVGRTTLYNLINAGRLSHIRVGAKILIPSDAFERLAETQERGTDNDNANGR